MRKIIVENARTVVAQADAEARDTLQRLSDIIAQYPQREGRKSVVFFSKDFTSTMCRASSSRWPRPPPRATPSTRST